MGAVELGYRVTVEGAQDLKSLADTQRAVHQGARETGEALQFEDTKLRQAAAGADLFSKKQEQLRQSQFKKGGSYDPELIEAERIKALGRAHQELDKQIEQQQLKQLSGLARINAERQKSLRDLSALKDPALNAKVNSLFDSQAKAEADRLKAEAKRKTEEAARHKLEGSLLRPELQLELASALQSPELAISRYGDDIAAKFGKAGLFVGGVTVALGAAAVAAAELVKNAGEFAEQTQNMAVRLNLTTAETLKLQAGAEIAGVSIEGLAGAGRILAQALEDPAGQGKKVVKVMDELGIKAYDAKGKFLEVGPLMISVLERLAKIPNPSDRIAAATRLLPREAASQILPYIQNLDELNKKVSALRISGQADLLPTLEKGADAFNTLTVAIRALRNELAYKISGPVIDSIETITDLIEGKKGSVLGGVGLALKVGANAALLANGGVGLPGLDKLNTPSGAPPVPTGDQLQDPLADLLNKRVGEAGGSDQELRKSVKAFNARFRQTIEGLEDQKKDLDQAIADSTAKLKVGNLIAKESRPAEEAKLRTNQGELHAVEEKLKELREQQNAFGELKKEVERLEKESREFELTGLQKINAQREDEIAKVYKTTAGLKEKAALIARINALYDAEASRFHGKQQAENIREQIDLQQQLLTLQSRPGRERETIEAQFQNSLRGAAQEFQADPTSDFGKALRAARLAKQKALNAQDEQEKRDAEAQGRSISLQGISGKASLAENAAAFNPTGTFNEEDEIARVNQIAQLRRQAILEELPIRAQEIGATKAGYAEELDLLKLQADTALRLQETRQQGELKILALRKQQVEIRSSQAERLLNLNAQPGQELEVAAQLRDIQIDAAKQLYDLDKNKEELEKRIQQAEFDHVVAILELRKRELEQFKNEAGQLFEAINSNKGPGQGLTDFGHGLLTNFEKTLFQNLSGIGFKQIQNSLPVISGQEKTVIGPDGKPVLGADGQPKKEQTFLGQLLAGTPLGRKAEDPLKAATEFNTTATAANTKAIYDLILAQQSIASGSAGRAIPGAPGGINIGPSLDQFRIPGLNVDGGGFESGPGALGASSDNPLGLPPFFSTTVTAAKKPSAFGEFLGGVGSAFGAAGPFAGIFKPGAFDRGGFPGGEDGGPGTDLGTSGAARVGNIVGSAGAVAGGVAGVISGIKQGGARGVSNAISSGLGTAAALDPEPISKAVLAVAALGTKLIGSLFGDPKAERKKEIDTELDKAAYHAPKGVAITIDSATGHEVDRDQHGNIRVLSSAPRVENYQQALGFKNTEIYGTQDGHPFLNTTTQRRVAFDDPLSPLPTSASAQALSAQLLQTQRTAAPVNIYFNATIPVTAFDSKSITDNSGPIADAITKAVQNGHRVRNDIINLVRPR